MKFFLSFFLCQDRCHRIGQTKLVTVYKLVTAESVDEDIFDMGERKRKLSEAVLGAQKSSKSSSSHTADDDIGAIGRILQKALLRVANNNNTNTNTDNNLKAQATTITSVGASVVVESRAYSVSVVNGQEIVEL